MSEVIRVRLLLARMHDDTEPTVIGAIDEVLWEHWSDEEEAAWIASGKRTWGIDYDTEFKVVVARFAPDDLVNAFATPETNGHVDSTASASADASPSGGAS